MKTFSIGFIIEFVIAFPIGVFFIDFHNFPTTGKAYDIAVYAGPNYGYNVDSRFPNPFETFDSVGP